MLAQFCYEDNQVRTIDIDGEPWFVGRDIASILRYKDENDAIKNNVDEEDKQLRSVAGTGQTYQMVVINESGLYSLILNSRMPTAKKFKRWVTSEVLPTIRKTGKYEIPTVVPTHSESLRLCADLYIKLADEVDKNLLLTEKLTLAEPKALIYDALILAGGTWDSKELAANLNCGLGPRQLLEYGIKKGYMFRDAKSKVIKPYQRYSKYLAMIPDLITYGDGRSKKYSKTVWLTEGVEHFIELLESDGYKILPASD